MATVIVIGGGAAGIATAARVSKLGHSVTLCEKSSTLGGHLSSTDGPVTLTLPAALRDLFRKSGRPLERELDLEPVTSPRRHVFDDGTVLDLPVTGRAEQRTAMADVLGDRTAEAWTRLVDGCVPLWDLLRRNVLEHRYAGPQALGPNGIRRLRPGRSLWSVARGGLPDERARLALAATAYGPGSDPTRAPAYQLVQVYVERTFGRFGFPGGPTTLLDAFRRRLAERRVQVAYDTEVVGIELADGAVTGVRLADGSTMAGSIVVCTVPVTGLLADPPAGLRHANQHDTSDDPGSAIGDLEVNEPLGEEPFEIVRYPATGRSRRDGSGGPRRLLRRPGRGGAPAPTRTPLAGLYCAGPAAQPGPGLPYELLGAALVAGEISPAARRSTSAG